MPTSSQVRFSERLWPSATFFIVLLLIIPAMTVLFMPQSLELGIIIGIVSYVMLVLVFMLMSRRIELRGTTLIAGHASIDTRHLGDATALDPHELRILIGHRADARAFLMVSGWVKGGIRVDITDPDDPTPYWVITTRKPQELIDAIAASRSEARR